VNIAAGVRLGPYEIVAPLGAGGMGEVYRARDTRLDRTVAIKVLPPQLAADPQLRERFEREARAVSSLQHPHICALFDVGHQDGVDFLVLEYLEGETLADRLARARAIPVADALKIAIEFCDALDKAHRCGIVHRDLKPANVMLTKSGAKLLDFGLAKTAAPVVTTSSLSMAATTPPNVTAQGTILGTFQYMAPEQIEGLDADARTDIFAFGAVLFEMLAGRTAFEGKTRASLLGAILKDEPPRVSHVQPVAPPALDRVVSTCLAKDPDDRYQSARDLLRDLRWVVSGAAEAVGVPAARPARYITRAGWAIVAALSIAMLAAAFIIQRLRPAPAVDPIQFSITPPPNATFATPPGGGTGAATQLAVSPDGRFVVFVGSGQAGFQLWLRSMNSLDARVLPGTESGTFPFWSPDSRYVAFFANGQLKKVNVAGGPPVVLCDASGGRGGAWNRDNVIVFSPASTGPLQRVSSAGGVPQPASTLDDTYGESSHRFPSFLPDGRHFVFAGTVGVCCPASKPARVRIGALDSLDAPTLLQVESWASFASGHLLFNRDGTLMAQAFDAARLRMSGDPFPIVEGVMSEGSRYASFSASESGTVVYALGGARATKQLTWLDRTGKIVGTVGEPAAYLSMALSPDDRRVAVSQATGVPENRDIWILDAARGTPRRFTFDPGNDNSPIWAPDGSAIVFAGNRDAQQTLRRKRVDDAAAEETIPTDARGAMLPTDWSADGRYVAVTRDQGTAGSADIWAVPLSGDRKPIPIAQSASGENYGRFAPDGHWIAYQSSESGSMQIYVQPFPPTGGRFQISKAGGSQPIWRNDGKELFFLSADSKLMAAAIDTTGSFQADTAKTLFTVNTTGFATSAGWQYGVSKDGRRFLMNVLQQRTTSLPLTVVVNWISAIQR
jgi:Tol biopolymer transport system component